MTEPTPTARALLGASIRRLMADARAREPDLTMETIAGRMLPGWSPVSAWSGVRRFLCGSRWPTPEQLDSMAAALGVEPAELLRPE
jgi:hypothetical protein